MNESAQKARGHVQPGPLGAPAAKREPVSRLKILAGAMIFILGAGFGIQALIGTTSVDSVSQSQQAQAVAALSRLSAVKVTPVAPAEVSAALDSMRLAPDARRALQQEMERTATAATSAAPNASAQAPQGTRLAWITLWDSMDEDGDAVTLASAGYEMQVMLAKAPQRFAVPVDGSATVRVTALRDGHGGGVTLGVQAGSGMVALPVMAPGQTLSLPVAF